MRDETQAYIRRIIDVFTGVDGGVEFIAFKALVEDMDAKATSGDEAAVHVIAGITRFVNTLKVASKFYGPNASGRGRGSNGAG